MFPVCYINLNRCADRNKNIINSLNYLKVDHYRISGIDAKEISRKSLFNNLHEGKIQNMKYMIRPNKMFTPREKEIAIILSHLKALEHVKNISDHEIAVIIEDDMSFQYVEDWNKQIEEIIKKAPTDWSIIKLHSSSKRVIERNISLWKKGIMYDKLTDLNSAGCYIIRKHIAQDILSKYCIDDTYTFPDNNQLCVCEHILFNIPDVYIYTLPLICSVKNNITCCGNRNILDEQSNKVIEGFWRERSALQTFR